MKEYGLEFSLNYIDYELYPPTKLDQARNAFDPPDSFHQNVPLIRIFGRTDAGQNVCALIHGVFPYMFIEYDGLVDGHSINLNCLKLHQNINVVLATTYRRNPHDDASTFVADISVCKATPFYGLHAGWKRFYKICLLSPKHMTRLADLFRSGAILGKASQPYESHVPYLLQFMIDYNLYGCGTLRCRNVHFRVPLPDETAQSRVGDSSDDRSNNTLHSLHGHSQIHVAKIGPLHILNEVQYPRRSHSSLEVDVAAGSIMNREKLRQRAIHSDILKEIANMPQDTERLLPSLTELWEDDTRRREALGLQASRSQLPRSNVRQRSNVWNNEKDLKDSLSHILQTQKRMQAERLADDLIGAGKEKSVVDLPTSFESVQHFCDRQNLIVSLNQSGLSGPTEHEYSEDIAKTTLTRVQLEKILNFENDRTQLMLSQSSHQPSQLQVVKEESESLQGFVSASTSDLCLDITLSGLSEVFYPRLLRLRGGCNDEEPSIFRFIETPPIPALLRNDRLDFISSEFPEPFYSDGNDVPLLAKDYIAANVLPKSKEARHLPPFDPGSISTNLPGRATLRFTYVDAPPSRSSINAFSKLAKLNKRSERSSTQIAMPTQVVSGNSKTSRKISEADVPLSVFSLEIHAQCRGSLLPNPAEDPVIAIFWAFQDFANSSPPVRGTLISTQELSNFDGLKKLPNHNIIFLETEIDLIHELIDLVRRLDPDAVLSFEMQNSSIGFIEERSKLVFGLSVQAEIGRIVADDKDNEGNHNDRWGETHATSVKVSGRHVLNLWRIMRSEMNLLQYTLENVCFHLLRQRVPKYSHTDLHRWITSGKASSQQRVLNYYARRTSINLEIIEAQGLLSRVSEQARLLGIDFYSVFSRGSQFKVESLMCRIAKPECFMMMSPSKKQVAQQNALECLPLVMEPQSKFYHDPVVVLDFQSLYPSIMIAYNFCYSTCLGKLGYQGLESKLGVTHYNPDIDTMQLVADDIEIAPNGVLFVRDYRRKSLLAKMLHDLLETRAMVKDGMKLCKNDKAAQKLMHNRQLALKLIANVTYGYTSASFSGRMPCSDIADSIVQTGRETLEKAIEFIHDHTAWNAEVVYGDTDSLFVKLPGRTKREAFEIGAQMANEITKMSPTPVKLKFEKVYLPCVLLAKKRYVGFKYESATDTEPVFDAKGIETVRRDGTPAEQKIEEQALKIMFRTGDLSAVKAFFQQECWKIMTGRCSLHDFCFAKEVKLGSYSTKGLPPPGAVISAKSIAADPRSEPQYGERVSYLVISGPARSRLTDRCVPPEELLLNPELRLDVEYYITKNLVPPLERIFTLMGVNVRSWYDEMPRSLKLFNTRPSTTALLQQQQQQQQATTTTLATIKSGRSGRMIETFLASNHCPVCHHEQSRPGICAVCASRPDETVYDIAQQGARDERIHGRVIKVCAACCGVPMYSEIACVSKDCPVYYKRVKSGREVNVNLMHDLLPSFAADNG